MTFSDAIRETAKLVDADATRLRSRRPGIHGVHQTTFGTTPPFTDRNPPGNCTQAAVATIFGLELDDVPHFVDLTLGDPRPGAWWPVFRSWSEDRFGVSWISLDPDAVLAIAWQRDARDVLLLGAGRSSQGPWGHTVVIDGLLELVWDPNPGGNGVESLWDVYVPVDPTPAGKNDAGHELWTVIDITLTPVS
jgi:hypothetical protein